MPRLILALTLSLLSACATTQRGEAFDLLDEDRYADALVLFERTAKEDSDKTSAVMASFLYLSDYQIPRNVQRAEHYYNLSLSLPYGRYEQVLDYWTPLARARLLLYDDDPTNNEEATNILRGDRYATHSAPLGLLAKTYAFGIGVPRDLGIARQLFERAIEYDDDVYSANHFAWWLVVHPDDTFRNPERARFLMRTVMEDEEVAERPTTLNTLAAVLAANHDYEQAVRTQKRALDRLTEETKDFPEYTKWRDWYQCRLSRYQNQTPWRYAANEIPFGGGTEVTPCQR